MEDGKETIAKLEEERQSFKLAYEELKARLGEQTEKIQDLEEQCRLSPKTGLYNDVYFTAFLQKGTTESKGCFLFIGVDRFHRINLRFGYTVADETLRKIAAILPNLMPPAATAFHLFGSLFAVFLSDADRETGGAAAERIRAGIDSTNIFADRITVSIGVVCRQEGASGTADAKTHAKTDDGGSPADRIRDLGQRRLNFAQRMGGNAVVAFNDIDVNHADRRKAIVADPDGFRRGLIAELLSARNFLVSEEGSGGGALARIEAEKPGLVVAELALPGMDALELRSRLNENSRYLRLPFILISDRKTAATAVRAYGIGVSVYLQRPVMIEEFLGLADNLCPEAL